MKTLNEVIKALETCIAHVKCVDVCPYHKDGCTEYRMEKDAHHYLKEYQTLHMSYVKTMADIEDNPPLSWDELTKMPDKPIWLEEREFCDDPFVGNWRLIDCIEMFRNDKDTERMRVTGSELESYGVYHRDLGEYWQAYRKERS